MGDLSFWVNEEEEEEEGAGGGRLRIIRDIFVLCFPLVGGYVVYIWYELELVELRVQKRRKVRVAGIKLEDLEVFPFFSSSFVYIRHSLQSLELHHHDDADADGVSNPCLYLSVRGRRVRLPCGSAKLPSVVSVVCRQLIHVIRIYCY